MCLYKMTLKGRPTQLSLEWAGHLMLLHQTVPNTAYKGWKTMLWLQLLNGEVKNWVLLGVLGSGGGRHTESCWQDTWKIKSAECSATSWSRGHVPGHGWRKMRIHTVHCCWVDVAGAVMWPEGPGPRWQHLYISEGLEEGEKKRKKKTANMPNWKSALARHWGRDFRTLLDLGGH